MSISTYHGTYVGDLPKLGEFLQYSPVPTSLHFVYTYLRTKHTRGAIISKYLHSKTIFVNAKVLTYFVR